MLGFLAQADWRTSLSTLAYALTSHPRNRPPSPGRVSFLTLSSCRAQVPVPLTLQTA
jgi:hypothetical protein